LLEAKHKLYFTAGAGIMVIVVGSGGGAGIDASA